MSQKIITVILVLAVIGGLAWYFNKTYLQPSTGQTQEQIPQFKTSSTDENFKGKLIYITAGAAKEIWEVDSKKQTKKLFTDADETEKLTEISNLAPLSKEVLAITSSETSPFHGRLIAIDLITAKESVLQKTFAVPSAWAVSPDGKKIALIKFSNLEENYGYTLYFEDRDGINLRELFRSDSEIKALGWNKDSSKIAFVKTSEAKSQLNILEISSAKTEEIRSFDNKAIDWVSWAGDKLVLSVRNLGNTQEGAIEIIDLDGKNLRKLTDFNGGAANFAYLENSLWLGYLIAQYKDQIDDSTAGQIYIKNLSGENLPVQKGNQILGWL